MKRVLITGATGFIGSALAKYLRAMNYHLVGLTRSIKLLPTNKQNLVDEWIECNLADDEFNYEVMSNVDYVVHLAGNAHLTKEAAYSEYYRNNTVATKKLATVAAQYSVEKFIFVSTIKVNGDNSESESNFTFTEDSDVNRADYYSQSKYEAEKVLKDICRLHEMDFVILRPPLVYGAGVFFIWLILGLMYFHAYNKRDILELDKNELLITTNSIIANFIVSFVAMISILMTILKIEYLSGWIYFSISPLIFIAIFIKEKYFRSDQ